MNVVDIVLILLQKNSVRGFELLPENVKLHELQMRLHLLNTFFFLYLAD